MSYQETNGQGHCSNTECMLRGTGAVACLGPRPSGAVRRVIVDITFMSLCSRIVRASTLRFTQSCEKLLVKK